MRSRTVRPVLMALAAPLALALSGCMRINTHIYLHEDGSATITEKVEFSHRLLDMKLDSGGVADMNTLLQKPAFEDRAKHLGEGCALIDHQIKDVPGGKEATAKYKIGDLNNFRYVSPWMAFLDYPENNHISFKLEPIYKSRAYANAKAGEMAVNMHLAKRAKGEARLEKDQPPPPGPKPAELQVYRDLQPVFRDMLEDFELRVTFEPYATIKRSGLGLRNPRGAPRTIELLWFSDRHLDKYGDKFVDNEEVFLDMLRWDLADADVVEQLRSFASNDTLPVMLPLGSRSMWHNGGGDICFAPSKALFDKHFVGKELNYNEWAAKDTDKKVPADFQRIGWKGEAAEEGEKVVPDDDKEINEGTPDPSGDPKKKKAKKK